MSSSAAGGNGRRFHGGPLIPILFFITPLFTAASPRLAPFLLPIVAVVLMIAALRRGLPWRDLLKPNAALVALVAVAAYAGLSAIWAADPEAALSKCALLLATTLVVFAASVAIPTLDADQIRRAPQAFVAGALCAAGFVAIELLTDGAITRATMNTFPSFRPERPKHVTIHHDWVTKINLSEFNQDIAILACCSGPDSWRCEHCQVPAASCSACCSSLPSPYRSRSRSTILRKSDWSPRCSSCCSPG